MIKKARVYVSSKEVLQKNCENIKKIKDTVAVISIRPPIFFEVT